MIRGIGWLAKMALGAVIVAGFTLYVTWVTVSTYVDQLLARYHVDTPQQKSEFSDFLANMVKGLNIVNQAGAQQTGGRTVNGTAANAGKGAAAGANAGADGTGASTAGSGVTAGAGGAATGGSDAAAGSGPVGTAGAAGTNGGQPGTAGTSGAPGGAVTGGGTGGVSGAGAGSGTAPTGTAVSASGTGAGGYPGAGDAMERSTSGTQGSDVYGGEAAVPAWSQSGQSSQKKLVMSAEEFYRKKEALSDADKNVIFGLLVNQLPPEELQNLSNLVEDGITPDELSKAEAAINRYLTPEQVQKLMGILAKYD